MKIKDEVLKKAIEDSGYYEFKEIAFNLGDEDIDYKTQVSVILAREIVKFRPDLLTERNPDLVYVICNGEGNYTLPSLDLTTLMENQKPYDDAYIAIFSLSEQKIISKIYKGNGTKWVSIK